MLFALLQSKAMQSKKRTREIRTKAKHSVKRSIRIMTLVEIMVENRKDNDFSSCYLRWCSCFPINFFIGEMGILETKTVF